MSYSIGQFRKDMLGRYVNKITFSKREIHSSLSSVVGDVYFKDVAFSTTGSFDYQKNYYVKIQIKRTTEDQTFLISLANLDNENSPQQFLKSFYIPAMRENDVNKTANIEIVFNPTISFTDLVIRLSRTVQDYMIQNADGSSGRTFDVVDAGSECYEIINIINTLNGVTDFNKIGVQGPSGLLMCINGQEIRVGSSGIYETRNGYKITFMGFIVTDSESSDYFILDYQY